MPDSKTILISIAVFLIGVAYASVLPYIAVIAIEEIGVTNSLYALLTVIFSGAVIVLSIALGSIFDRIEARAPIVVACATLGLLGFGAIYLYRNPLVFAFSYCLLVPFSAVLFSQAFGYAKSHFLARDAAKAEFRISFLRTLFSLAWVISPPMAALLVATYSISHALLIAVISYIITALVFLFLGKWEVAASKPHQVATPSRPKPLNLQSVKEHGTGVMGMIFIKTALVMNGMALPLFLLNDLQGTAGDVGYATSIPAFIEIPFILLWARVVTRYGKLPVLTLTTGLFAAYLSLVYFATSSKEVLVLQILNGVAAAALISVSISYLQEAIPGRLGLSTSLIDVVSIAATFLSGAAFAFVTTSVQYRQVFIVGAAAAFLGILFIGLAYRQQKLNSAFASTSVS